MNSCDFEDLIQLWNKDELFSVARKIVDLRHLRIIYSPTEDIFKLRECVLDISFSSWLRCRISNGIYDVVSKSTGFGLPGLRSLIQQPIIADSYVDMLDEINSIIDFKIVNRNDLSVVSILKKLSSFTFDLTKDALASSFSDFFSSEKSNYNGGFKSRWKNKIVLYFSGIGVYVNSVAFGWMYLKLLAEICENGVYQLDAKSVSERLNAIYNNNKERIKNIINHYSKLILDIINTEMNFGDNSEDAIYEILKKQLMSSGESYQKEMDFKLRIEKFEIENVMKNFEVTSDFNSVFCNDWLSTIICIDYEDRFDELKESSIYEKSLCAFSNCFEIDLLKYESAKPKINLKSINELPIIYSKYVTDELESPNDIWVSDLNESYIQKAYVQYIGVAVNTINLVKKNAINIDSIPVSELYVLWAHLTADIVFCFNSGTGKEKLHECLPVLVKAILSIFTSNSLYSIDRVYQLKCECKKKVRYLEDILSFLPDYYMVLRDGYVNQNDFEKLVNSVFTIHIGNTFIDAISSGVSLDCNMLYKNLINVNIDEEILKRLLAFEHQMLN